VNHSEQMTNVAEIVFDLRIKREAASALALQLTGGCTLVANQAVGLASISRRINKARSD